MNDTFSFALESPLTEEQINLITDAELEHTNRIWFDTPKGKHIEFVKAPQWIPCSEQLPEYGKEVLTINTDGDYEINHIIDEEDAEWFYDGAIAWMPLPKPYEERREDA